MAQRLLDILKGKKADRPAFWFMRQAGRYLPEYRKLRKQAGSFLDLCYTPELAAEVTLQPIHRFDMDAAIIFSDILVVPHAMGVNLGFHEGEGPRLTPLRDERSIKKLSTSVEAKLQPIARSLKFTRNALQEDKTLIGFAGAPWTVAAYMVEGGGSKDFSTARGMAYKNPKLFSALIKKISDATERYLSLQVKAGADVIMLFDSWAGLLPQEEFKRWVIEPTRALIKKFRVKHPSVPIIGFPRGAGLFYPDYVKATGVSAIGIDTHTPMLRARKNLSQHAILQGNLDPVLLAEDKKKALAVTRNILQEMKRKPFIFNLGHGIMPHTPPEHVKAVSNLINNYNSDDY